MSIKSGLSIKLTEGKEELPAQNVLLFTKVPPVLPAFAITVPATFSLKSTVGQELLPSAMKLLSAEYNPSIVHPTCVAILQEVEDDSPIVLLTVIFPLAENIAVEPTGTIIFPLIVRFPLTRIIKFPAGKV